MSYNFFDLIRKKQPFFLMEAHNGISAKIVENAGFDAIWASGLSISATLGLRDSNELSWGTFVEILSFMTDAVNIPILVDGDTGYGNFNNARIFSKRLQKIGIAGVCFEDKLFPKHNSFLNSSQDLASIEEFCGKIKACRDYVDKPFFIVARTEALIAKKGIDEAIKRAEAYSLAGADALIIHSKGNDGKEILEFLKLFNNKIPTIIIPTKYYTVPTQEFINLGVSGIIWANHNVRASIKAMKETSGIIQRTKSLVPIENKITSLQTIFDLTNQKELDIAERIYLP